MGTVICTITTLSGLLTSPMFLTSVATLIGALATLITTLRAAGLFTKLGNRAETNSASTDEVVQATVQFAQTASNVLAKLHQVENGHPANPETPTPPEPGTGGVGHP